MNKTLKRILLVLLVALLVIQFFRPDKNAAEMREVAAFETETNASPEMVAVLKSKCYDCHSNKTVYPWYAEVAPVSFWLADHVEEGKEHFDVSAWETYSLKKKDHKLEELIEEVEEGEMPLPSYTWIHGNISEEEKEAMLTWAKEARAVYSKQLVAE